MTLKGGSSVGLHTGGDNADGFTTNAEEQADARALKEKMQARTTNSPAPAGIAEGVSGWRDGKGRDFRCWCVDPAL